MTLKVLHIGSTAGIGGYLANFMSEYYDVDSLVMIRTRYDPYNFSNEFVKSFDCSFKEFLFRCWIKGLFYDIIHIHGSDKVLKIFKLTLPYKNKKIIIHYHGSDIRNKWRMKEYRWKYADKIIVSTPDLLEGSPDGTEYLPNVINEKLCSTYRLNKKYRKSSFHVYHKAMDKALEYSKKYKLRLNIHHIKRNPLKHFDFLKQLSMYEYYIDVKKRKGNFLKAISLTGLEALYMGVKLIMWDGKRVYRFPTKHLSINVCNKLNLVYNELMK